MAEEDANWRVWLATAQQGDRRSYASLLSAALPWLRSRARVRWPRSNAADIEDILQETLLALDRSPHLYKPPRNPPLLRGNALGTYRYCATPVTRSARLCWAVLHNSPMRCGPRCG